jgi:isopenicillin N synthase-like dioxygenase
MNILTVDYLSSNAPYEFAKSLHETGFVILFNHPLKWSKIKRSYDEWHNFFQLDAKHNYKFNPDKQDGYIPMEHEHQAANSDIHVKDIKEVFQLYFPWGQYPKEISNLTLELFNEKFTVAKNLLQWAEDNLPLSIKSGLKKKLVDIVDIERTLYRAIHYPPLYGNEETGALRAAAHEDFSILTLLPCSTEAGLQVKDRKGNWHDVGADPETIVVNAGGTLQEATKAYYKSTFHRVVNPKGEKTRTARLSLPLFLHAYADAYLSEQYPTVGGYFDEQIRKLALWK